MINENQTVNPIIQSNLNKAQIDKWIFFFNLPDPMRKLDKNLITDKGEVNSNSVQYTLNKVKIPEVKVKAISQRYGSDNLYVSSHAKEPYEPLNITFEIDNQFQNYLTIYEWLNLIHDEKEGYPDPKNLIGETIGLKSYWTNLGIVGLDEYNVPKIQYTFTQAFPTRLGGIDFDMTKASRISIDATFAFSQMHISIPTHTASLKG